MLLEKQSRANTEAVSQSLDVFSCQLLLTVEHLRNHALFANFSFEIGGIEFVLFHKHTQHRDSRINVLDRFKELQDLLTL